MRTTSKNPVGYVEMPGTGRGFDVTDGKKTGAAVRAIGVFLEHVRHSRPNTPADAVG